MNIKEKSKEEILGSRDMKEVFEWLKAHPGQEHKDVSEHFNDLTFRKEVETHIRIFGYYNPENRYDPNPRPAIKDDKKNNK